MLDIHQVTIRKMVAHDATPIAQAFAHMHKNQEQYERYWQENVVGERVTLIAELEGSIVGYTNIVWKSGYVSFCQQGIPEINDMNVIAPLRCNGIGTKMIECAEQIVRLSGKSVIGIGVGMTPGYEIAQRLYPKLGYVEDGSGFHNDEWGGGIYLTKSLG
ncbi:MAG: GNAT family N-acetyltransferase [Chloroflexota bacterium]